MSFQEVTKTPTVSEINNLKREHKRLTKKYESLKYQFTDAINWDDFETLNVQDFLELKELYIKTKKLYWKIHTLEHPEDNATREAYSFLNRMSHNDQNDFLMKHHLTTHQLIDAIKENPNFLSEVTV